MLGLLLPVDRDDAEALVTSRGEVLTYAALRQAAETAAIVLRSGANPVAGRPISVLVSGSDLPLAATTGADGTTTVAVTFPPSGTVTVVASTPVPAPAAVYAGRPVTADPDGPQTLLTGGGELSVQATAQLVLSPPDTTTPVTTPTTTSPATPAPQLDTSTVQQDPALPNTGRGDGGIAQLATALLVGGIGLMGTLRRREAPLTPGSSGTVDSGA